MIGLILALSGETIMLIASIIVIISGIINAIRWKIIEWTMIGGILLTGAVLILIGLTILRFGG